MNIHKYQLFLGSLRYQGFDSYHIITILLPSTILASPRFPSVCLGLCANTAEVGAKRAHAEAVVLRIDSGRKYVLRNLERRSNVEMSIQ